YDGDGDPDAFFVDGGALPGYDGEEPRSRLFRNDGPPPGGGAPRFTDVTERSGIRLAGYGSGATAGDVDGDGDLDLYVTQLGPNQLFENRGDGTFADVTAEAGVGDPAWSASATFFDADRDGDLDLYVTNYVAFTVEDHKVCQDRGVVGYCQPDAYPGLPDRLYVNRGDGTFEDATERAGLAGADHAGLGVVAGDLDGDGWPDLYVANDADPNYLFRNLGAERQESGEGSKAGEAALPAFEDLSLLSGTALDSRGRAEGGMGVDLGDVDGDGALDVVVTNFEVESNALYRNSGQGLFVDWRFNAGIADPSLPMLGFGVDLADLDHDGDLDLLVANGHILDNAAEINPESRFAQPNQVFENRGDGRFREVPDAGLDVVRVSRGLATGDLDGDGDLDVAIVDSNDRAEVYENLEGASSGGWLQVDLRETPGGEPFGIGTRLELRRAGGAVDRPDVREVRTASSYLSQNALTAHFGLGPADEATVTVRWPDGAVRTIRGLPANRRVTVFGDRHRDP
ncbi:MAG: CRTAC1 family protein, partial [Acidobacteriota bacterium]